MKELREIKTNDLKTYFGSPLNQLIRENGRKDMVVINIDLAINYYKEGNMRFIESKRGNERMGKGQEIFLQKMSDSGLDVFTIYGDYPYERAKIYCFKHKYSKVVDTENLLQFINNKKTFEELE